MINSSSNQTLTLHDHPSPTHSRSYVSLHLPQQQNMMNNMMILPETPASSFHPTEVLEMSDVIAGSGGATVGTSATTAGAGQSEHYIYVTYPPELKRRLLER